MVNKALSIKAHQTLRNRVIHCKRCPRLIDWCQTVAKEKVKRFEDQAYWGKPVPSWGDPNGKLLIVGLAPAAHGANRTGRMFTGDRSGDWLYRALHKAGFASKADAIHAEDGLELINTWMSTVAHCAPPLNKLTKEERHACQSYLLEEVETLIPWQVILCLGKTAFDDTWSLLKQADLAEGKRPSFGHGIQIPLPDGRTLFGSYHPSQQNTFTKRLTEPMFDRVFQDIQTLLQT